MMTVIHASSSSSSSTEVKTPTTRQAGSGLGNIFSLGGFTGMASAVMPILLAVGLGALVLPLLGGAIFLREGRKLDFPRISPAFMDSMADLLDKVVKALDAVENKYWKWQPRLLCQEWMTGTMYTWPEMSVGREDSQEDHRKMSGTFKIKAYPTSSVVCYVFPWWNISPVQAFFFFWFVSSSYVWTISIFFNSSVLCAIVV